MNTVQVASVDDVTIDLGVILRALWRARVRIVLLTLAAAVGSWLVLSSMTPSFKADTRLVIETHEVPVGSANRQAESERAILDEQGVGSQVQLLTSRDIARRVVATLGLVRDPEFASGSRSLLALVGLGGGESTSSEERVLEKFIDQLNVFQVEKTRVIQVEFSSRDPEKAAKVAGAVVDEYLKAAAEAKGRTSADASKFLSSEIEQLRRRVAEAESKVEQYRTGADLFVGQNNVKISEQQIGELNSQLTAAKAQRSETEARVRQLKRLLESGTGLETASEVSSSPSVLRLRDRQSALKARAAELATTYLPNHPQVQAVTAQIAEAETQIRAEASKVLASYESDLKVAEGRVKQLSAQFNEFKSQAAKAGEEDIQLRALEREAKVQRDQLEEFLARYRDAVARQVSGAQPADARVISAATAPVKPAFPKVLPLTAAITLSTFLIICLWIVMREFTSGNVLRHAPAASTVAAAGAAAAVGPVPTAGTAPVDGRVAAHRLEAPEISGLLPHTPASAFDRGAAASLERIWNEISDEAEDGQRIVVTSATSDHASHLAALALLRVAAKRGAKVCLVGLAGDDEDLAELVGDDDMPGLSDLLSGEARFADIIFRDRGSRGHVVLAGREGLEADDLAGDELAGALEALDLTYDHLILDLGIVAAEPGTADLVASADAVILAADGPGSDPHTAKAHQALIAAGLPSIRVLAVDDGDVKSIVEVAA
ncbi:MAG: exopolysaccharide transport family protein [Siculibacillus sp.]|nr:exopolysaccharide transport family protein [Siculibacillus sp.]